MPQKQEDTLKLDKKNEMIDTFDHKDEDKEF